MKPLVADVLRMIDPVALAAEAGIDADDWQKGILRSQASRILVNGARQVGKSAVSALLAMHVALYEPGSLVLTLAPSLRQSQELYRQMLTIYKALGRPVPAETENTMQMQLASGSRIVALPATESSIRGFSAARLLCVDEASRVGDALWHSVSPMVAVSQGRIVAISTPNGRRGWWYRAWQEGSQWERYTVRASECPRISAEYLDEQRREMPGWMYEQEFEGHFGDSDVQAFRSEDIEAAFDPELEPWALTSA